jgi:hypothetical protein
MAIVEPTPTPMPIPRVAVLLAADAEVCACDEAMEEMLDVMKLEVTACAGLVMTIDVVPVAVVEGPVDAGSGDVVVGVEVEGEVVDKVVVAWTRAYNVPVVLFSVAHPYDVYVGATPAVGSPMRTQFWQ